MSEWVSQWVSLWVNEWVSERANERVNEWETVWVNPWIIKIRIIIWLNENTSELFCSPKIYLPLQPYPSPYYRQPASWLPPPSSQRPRQALPIYQKRPQALPHPLRTRLNWSRKKEFLLLLRSRHLHLVTSPAILIDKINKSRFRWNIKKGLRAH